MFTNCWIATLITLAISPLLWHFIYWIMHLRRPKPVYFKSPATDQSHERCATAQAAGLMLVRQHPISLSPLSLSTVSVYFTRVQGHSLTPVPAHACWILRWEALHIVLLQIVLQVSSGTKAWHSTMCREKAALTKNGENGCFRRLIEKTEASTLTLLSFVQGISQKTASSMVSKLLISLRKLNFILNKKMLTFCCVFALAH